MSHKEALNAYRLKVQAIIDLLTEIFDLLELTENEKLIEIDIIVAEVHRHFGL